MTWLLSAAGLLGLAAAGDLLLQCLRPAPRPEGPYRASLAFGLGLAVVACLAFWLDLAGAPLSPALARAMGGVLVLAAGAVRLLRKRGGEPSPPGSPGGWARWALLLAGLFVILTAGRSLWEPLAGWDSRMLWGNYTRVLFYEQSAAGPGFTDPDRVLQHANYPLLLPLVQWYLSGWMGSPDDRAVMLLFPLCFAALLGLVRGCLAPRLQEPWPSLLAAFLAGVPLFWGVRDGSVFSGYADVPLTLLSAALAVACWEWLESRDRGWLAVLAVAAVGAVFTKRGGLLIAGLAFLALLLSGPRRRFPWPVLLLCLLALVPWWLHQAGVTLRAPQNYLSRLYLALGPLGGLLTTAPALAFQGLRSAFLAPGTWALFWWAPLLSALTGRHGAPERRLFLAMLLLYPVAVWLYLVRGLYTPSLLDANDWGRYLLPLTPWAVFYVGAGLREGADNGGGTAREGAESEGGPRS